MPIIKIEIKAPQDVSLNKVRVYAGPQKQSASLYVEDNLLYEGDLIQSINYEQGVPGVASYFGLEYYNDEGKRVRHWHIKRITPNSDIGPWGLLPPDKRYLTGNDEVGVFVNEGILDAVIPSSIQFWQVFSALIAPTVTQPPPLSPMDILSINGVPYAFPRVQSAFGSGAANLKALHDKIKNAPASDYVVVSGGFKWRIEILPMEDMIKLWEAFANNNAAFINLKVISPIRKQTLALTAMFAGNYSSHALTRDQILAEGNPTMTQYISGVEAVSGTANVINNPGASYTSWHPICLKYIGPSE